MTARTAWTPGNGETLSWGTVINTTDVQSMATASSVLSGVADITNGTALDMFMDVSMSLSVTSSTGPIAGANVAFWLYPLNQDGTTYGDNQFSAGTQKAATPNFPPFGTFASSVATTATTSVGTAGSSLTAFTFTGTLTGVVIPPGSFRVTMQNNYGVALSTGPQSIKYRTYNINLNN